MKKILFVARREFVTTVMTRGFIIGLLLMPALMALFSFVFLPRMNQRAQPIEGMVAVVDPTGQVTERMRAALAPEAVADRRAAVMASGPAGNVNAGSSGLTDLAIQQARTQALDNAPTFHLVTLDTADAGRRWLVEQTSEHRLGVITVHPDAVQFEETPGGYDLLVAPRLDPRVENGIYDGMHEALVSARVAAMGLDRARLTTIMNVRRPVSVTLTSTGEQPSNNGLATMLPFAFVGLMFIGVMVGGQRLMTTTIEEKSSRVVEVLLSAISPLELMAGKILGQLAVSALALAVYLVLGGSVLSSLAMFGLVQPMHVVYLVVFYVLGYMTFGALMATIGAAVNDINEAQSLMMPVTLLIITPLVLVAPIVRAPSSMLATILSFTPPVNTFVMLIRITSLAPPPAWQIALSMLISLAGVVAAMWFAAKVFKVGLLMFGKPPNFATLVKWVRMA